MLYTKNNQHVLNTTNANIRASQALPDCTVPKYGRQSHFLRDIQRSNGTTTGIRSPSIRYESDAKIAWFTLENIINKELTPRKLLNPNTFINSGS